MANGVLMPKAGITVESCISRTSYLGHNLPQQVAAGGNHMPPILFPRQTEDFQGIANECLENEGLAKRTYGGAVLSGGEKSPPPYAIRKNTNAEGKLAIAQMAAARQGDSKENQQNLWDDVGFGGENLLESHIHIPIGAFRPPGGSWWES